MLRRWLMLFVLFWIPLSMASTLIYDPVSGSVTDGGTFYIGKVGASHPVKIIINAEDPSPVKKVEVEVPAKISLSAGRLFVEFNAPDTEGHSHVTLTLYREDGIESFTLAFDVVREGLIVKPETNVIYVPEAGRSELGVWIENPLSSSTEVSVYSSFPSKTSTKFLPRHEIISASITLYSGLSGIYDENIYVTDLYNGDKYAQPVTVVVTPTLRGRIAAMHTGPDYFLPLLYPARLILEVLLWMT